MNFPVNDRSGHFYFQTKWIEILFIFNRPFTRIWYGSHGGPPHSFTDYFALLWILRGNPMQKQDPPKCISDHYLRMQPVWCGKRR